MDHDEIVTLNAPQSIAAEAYRTLKNNIQFLALDNKIQTIVVTSSKPMEGKTTIASNLAVVMSQMGSKVLIVDYDFLIKKLNYMAARSSKDLLGNSDLRKSKIHYTFGITNEKEVSNVLINEANFKDVIKNLCYENLYILTSGSEIPNPVEILASNEMKNLMVELKDSFDYIILDAPPINSIADTQFISQYSDGCILVVSSGKSKLNDVLKAKELLKEGNVRILGVVLNKM